ncbi:MAG: hypothetical protein GXO58_06545 [Thermodesulfobacteria bacterium]|nr:hypothetical protein [Thermodesulfobacteriota bacterium]
MAKGLLIVSLVVAVAVAGLPGQALANIVWPALIAETKISSFPIIALSLFIEFWFFKWLFKLEVKDATLYTLAANGVSAVLGIFLRPLSGIAYEFSLGLIINWLFNWGTFNPVAWFFVPIIAGAVNAILELATIRVIWQRKINKRNYALTWAINTATAALATLWVILYPPPV